MIKDPLVAQLVAVLFWYTYAYALFVSARFSWAVILGDRRLGKIFLPVKIATWLFKLAVITLLLAVDVSVTFKIKW